MKYNFILLLLGLVFQSGLLAQQHVRCGVDGSAAEQLTQRLLTNKQTVKANQLIYPRSTVYVPIKFHLVGDDNGEGRAADKDVLTELCLLNEEFADQDIQFYLKGDFNYYSNSTLYEEHYRDGNRIFGRNKEPNALNVYLVGNANSSPSDPDESGVVGGYYSVSRDWIVMRSDALAFATFSIKHTLPHEIGHFFSLLHPHNGWDNEIYNVEQHGDPAPVVSPNFVLTEKQDGSNCEVAGDKLCDTAPDYNFGFGWPSCREYDGGAKDPDGAIVDPDEELFMSYFICSRGTYYFSDQQKDLMMADLMSNSRSHLRVTNPTNTQEITDKPTLLSPANAGLTNGYRNIVLEWSAVRGADRYLVEVSTAPNFPKSGLLVFFADDNKVNIPNLEPDQRYFWRVRPFNAYYTCQGFTNFRNFKTTSATTSVSTIEQVENWSVRPNPSYGAELQLQLSNRESFRAVVKMYDYSGKEVLNFGQLDFVVGEQTIPLSTAQLPGGLYVLNVISEKGALTEKVVLVR